MVSAPRSRRGSYGFAVQGRPGGEGGRTPQPLPPGGTWRERWTHARQPEKNVVRPQRSLGPEVRSGSGTRHFGVQHPDGGSGLDAGRKPLKHRAFRAILPRRQHRGARRKYGQTGFSTPRMAASWGEVPKGQARSRQSPLRPVQAHPRRQPARGGRRLTGSSARRRCSGRAGPGSRRSPGTRRSPRAPDRWGSGRSSSARTGDPRCPRRARSGSAG